MKSIEDFDEVRVFFDSRVEWKKGGLLHRLTGPAVIRNTGVWEWHVDGVRLPYSNYLKLGGKLF